MVGRRQRLTFARWIRRVTIISHFSAERDQRIFGRSSRIWLVIDIITAEGDEEVRERHT